MQSGAGSAFIATSVPATPQWERSSPGSSTALRTGTEAPQGTGNRERAAGTAQPPRERTIAAPRDKHDLPQRRLAACDTATVCPPWRPAPRSRLIPLFEARSDTQRRERPGPAGDLVPAGGNPRAALRRSTDSPPVGHHPLSRAAVTAVTSRGGASPQGAATPCGLTADPAHNRQPFAGRAQLALQTHSPSSPALRPTADVRALAAPASSTAHTLGRAHAPGASPTPSRLMRTPADRPLTGLPSGREAASLPAADARASDAARTAPTYSATATPAAGVSAAQGDVAASHPHRAPKPSTTRARVAHLPAETVGNEGASHTDLHSGLSAVSALSVGEGQVMFHPLQER